MRSASCLFFSGSVLFKGELRKYAKNSNFEKFKSALNFTSVSVHLLSLFYFCSGSLAQENFEFIIKHI